MNQDLIIKKIIFNFVFLFISFLTSLCANSVSGEELQKNGINSIEKYIENFRMNNKKDKTIMESAFNNLLKSIEIFEKEKNLNQKTLSLIKIGDIYRIEDKSKKAYLFYKQALALAMKEKNSLNTVKALLGKAKIEMYVLKEYGVAEDNIDTALQLIKKIDNMKVSIEVLDFKSQIQVFQNKLVPATITLNRALKKAKLFKDETLLYFIYFGLGDVHSQLAKQCDYAFYFDECKDEVLKAKNNYNEAIGIAQKKQWRGNKNIIESMLHDVKAYEKIIINGRKRQSTFLRELNLFHPKTKDDIQYTKDFIVSDTSANSFWAIMEKKVKALIDEKGSLSPSDSLLVKDLENVFDLNDSSSFQTTLLQGLYLESKAKNSEALEKFLLALSQMEQEQLSLTNNQVFNNFIQNKMTVYYSSILHLLQKGNTQKALKIFERSRSLTLRTLLENKMISLVDTKEHKNLTQKMQLYAKVSLFQNKYTQKQSKEMLGELSKVENEYRNFIQYIKKTTPNLYDLTAPKSPVLKDIQEMLKKEKSEILEYLVQSQQLIVWHITADKIEVKSVWLPRKELIGKVKQMKKTLLIQNSKLDFDEISSKELFLYLIQPVLDNIESKHLVIIPHDVLNKLPFQSLMNPKNNQFLGEKFQISYAPSASIWMRLHPIQNFKDRKILAVANPSMSRGLDEVNNIVKLFSNMTKVTDHLITKRELFEKIAGHSIIHLSVHGKYEANSPMLSHLKLAPKGSQGNLTASEMFGLPLEKNSFVTLSACESGRIQATQSNETLGIVRGLLYAGADALLLSSWRVDEEATALWMETFYKVAQTESLAEASRQAIIKVKNIPKYSHPHYWAGFSMIGK